MNKKTKKRKSEQKTHADHAMACKRRARALRKLDRLFADDAFANRYDCGSTIEDAGSVSFEFRYA